MVPTYFYTRFGIGISDSTWWEYRLRLFHAITYSSLIQHLGPSLRWIIFIDAKMPRKYLRRLQTIVQDSRYIRIEPVAVYPAVPGTLQALVRHHDEVRVVRIDDDDAISEDFFRLFPAEAGVHTLPSGYEVDLLRRTLRPLWKPSLSLNTVFHGRPELVQSFARVGHHIIPKWAKKHRVQYNEIDHNNKAFIYSRHKQSDSNFAAVRKSIAEDPLNGTFTAGLRRRFGLDDEKYLDWRRHAREAPNSGSRKTWSINTELNKAAAEKLSELEALAEAAHRNTGNLFTEQHKP